VRITPFVVFERQERGKRANGYRTGKRARFRRRKRKRGGEKVVNDILLRKKEEKSEIQGFLVMERGG